MKMFFEKRWINCLFMGCLIILLGSCGTYKKKMPSLNDKERSKIWEQRQKEMSVVKKWQLTGRVNVKIPEKSGTVSLDWRENSGSYSVVFTGPMNTLIASIEGDENGATMTLHDKNKVLADRDLDTLLEQYLGRRLPANYLFYWVLGIPAPDQIFKSVLDNWGNPKELSQAGWKIHYKSYHGIGTLLFPADIQVISGDMKLHILVNSWEI